MIQIMEQKRAAHALAIINGLRERDGGWKKKYVSYVESLPATILLNGLGQAMAMLLSAAKSNRGDAHYVLFSHVQDWLCYQCEYSPYYRGERQGSNGGFELMTHICERSRDDYLRAQMEALAWLKWLKRFAVAFLKESP